MSRVWILPMAGQGTRVQALGECKPAIVVAGRPIVGWCLTGLSRHVVSGDVVAAITTAHFEEFYGLSAIIEQWLSWLEMPVDFRLVTLDETPAGPAASVYAAQNIIPGGVEVICINADQYCEFEFPGDGSCYDGFVPLYVNTSGSSSYARVEAGKVKQIEEKQWISCYASAGIYGFRSSELLFSALSRAFLSPPHRNGEYFIGPAMNAMARDGLLIAPSTVLAKFDLGSIPAINRFREVVDRWRIG